MTPESPLYRSWCVISRGQVTRNYQSVREAVGPGVSVMGVVKAEAYGHGMVEVSRTLAAAGAEWLAVSSVSEGVALREAGLVTGILVMAGVMFWEWPAVVAHRLTPVIHALEELQHLEAASESVPFHLKIDTGMGRLGTRAPLPEIIGALRGLRRARFEGLMTHFASAADFRTVQTEEQIGRFNDAAGALAEAGLSPRWLHLASTNALAYARPGAWRVLVRPGHALYGYVSPALGHAPHPALQVSPALTWKTRIIVLKDLPEGVPVGYGAGYVTARPTRIAVLAAGYADGVPHRLSNRGRVIVGGRLAPMLGTVSMDLTTVDVTGIPGLAAGSEVTLLGREGDVVLDAQQIARAAGTISYNVLCGIKARVYRIYC